MNVRAQLRSRRGSLPLMMLATALTACGHDVEGRTMLDVEYAGCTDVLEGPRCLLGPGDRVTLWFAAPQAALASVSIGSRAIDVVTEAEAIDGGLRVRLSPELLPSTIHVVVRHDGGMEAAFALSLDRAPQRAWAQEVRALVRAGQFDDAAARLESAMRDARDDERGSLLSALARIELRRGHHDIAANLLERAIAQHRLDAERSAEMSDAAALAYQRLNRDDDAARAIQVLDAMTALVPGDARSAVSQARLRGDVAKRQGDLIGAEAHYRGALVRAHRVDESLHEVALRVGLAQVHAETGRFDRAVAQLAGANATVIAALSYCDQARFWNTRAWIRLLAHEAGVAVEDPLPDLARARSVLAGDCPNSPVDMSNVQLNLALAHLQRGETDLAATALQAARDALPQLPAKQEAWAREIGARIELARGNRGAALQQYRDLEQRAGALLLIDAEWRAALGQAAVHAELGSIDKAIAAAQRADRLLRDYVRLLPSSDDRALYLARYDALPRRLVDLLIGAGRIDEAWQVARRYRIEALTRMQRLAQIHRMTPAKQAEWHALVGAHRRLQLEVEAEAQRDWQLPAAELVLRQEARIEQRRGLRQLAELAATMLGETTSTPASPSQSGDELSLLYFPVVEGWVGFAHRPGGITAQRIAAFDADADTTQLSAKLLEPFRDEIDAAARLKLMTYGALRDLDFHRLPWHGAVLGTSLSVSYALDLEPLALSDRSIAHALLIGDPAGDLPNARAEIDRVRGALQTRQPPVVSDRMLGTAITASALHDALGKVELFHYAGHTTERGGVEALAGLALGEGRRFDLGDILTLEHAPRLAVLSACSSAAADVDAASETLSIAHAFLLRGSEQVIAATRPVNDRDTAALIDAMYRRWVLGATADLALALAQREVAATLPGADWAAFRLYTR